MAFTPGTGRTTLSEINVTPLVDVMLVLLIIFMVTAPMIQQGVGVELPKTETVPLSTDQDRNLITIDREGRIFLGTTEIPLEELETKVAANYKVQQQKELFLYADRSLQYDLVVRVMAILRRAGVAKLGMVTEPLERQ